MIYQLEKLADDERQLVIEAPVLVSVLIALADNDFTEAERAETLKLIHTKTFSERGSIRELYKELEKDVESRIDHVLAELPAGREERTHLVSEKLSGLNTVLPKLENGFARRFYKSLKELAYYISTIHHPLLGEVVANHHAKALMPLPMIQEPQEA